LDSRRVVDGRWVETGGDGALCSEVASFSDETCMVAMKVTTFLSDPTERSQLGLVINVLQM
jgi:hypothetical protein